jgi:hypothetical protein
MPARSLYAVFRRDGAPNVTPLARWRLEGAGLECAAAVEREGVAVVVLHRDEDPEIDEPAVWKEISRTEAQAYPARP